MHKAAILAKLVAKYPGLPKAFLGTLADKLSPKVTEESQIEGAVAELDNLPMSVQDMSNMFQSEGDRRATEAVEKHKKENPEPGKTDPTKTTDPPAPKKGEEENETLKLLREMQNELKAMKTEKAVGGLKDQLLAEMKKEGIPEVFAKYVTLTPETKIDDLITQLKEDSKDFIQADTTTRLKGAAAKPGGGSDGKGGAATKEATKEEADKVLSLI